MEGELQQLIGNVQNIFEGEVQALDILKQQKVIQNGKDLDENQNISNLTLENLNENEQSNNNKFNEILLRDKTNLKRFNDEILKDNDDNTNLKEIDEEETEEEEEEEEDIDKEGEGEEEVEAEAEGEGVEMNEIDNFSAQSPLQKLKETINSENDQDDDLGEVEAVECFVDANLPLNHSNISTISAILTSDNERAEESTIALGDTSQSSEMSTDIMDFEDDLLEMEEEEEEEEKEELEEEDLCSENENKEKNSCNIDSFKISSNLKGNQLSHSSNGNFSLDIQDVKDNFDTKKISKKHLSTKISKENSFKINHLDLVTENDDQMSTQVSSLINKPSNIRMTRTRREY